MAFRAAAAASILCLSFWTAQTKIYDRCELARELRDVHEFPEQQLGTWLCIANYESHFNTSAHNPGSGDHGIFQISELYWCSPPGDGFACGLPCAALKDDDIEDDAVCARRIYRQHQRMSGDGFTAWVVYNLHCRNPSHVASFLQGCFDEENLVKYGGYGDYQPIYAAMNLPTVIVPMPSVSPSPPPSVSSITPFVPSPDLSSLPPPVSSLQPSVSSLPPPVSSPRPSVPSPRPVVSSLPPLSSHLPPPPRKSTTPYQQVQFKSTIRPVTTPKPHISTYKPLLNLSTRFTSSAAPKLSAHKPVSSNIRHSSPSSTSKPRLPFVTTPKPTVVKINKASTFKPASSTFRVPSPYQYPLKVSTYKPISSTFRTTPVTTIRFTTPKPTLSTYRPFLNRFSSFQTPKSPNKGFSPFVTTSRPSGAISTYKPFLNNFSTTHKPQVYSFSTPKQVSSSFVSSSGLTSSPFSSSKLFIGNEGSSKATVVKPRETKTELPFAFKSGDQPFKFHRNETVYAYVNTPGYSFAISSHGFKFLRTAE